MSRVSIVKLKFNCTILEDAFIAIEDIVIALEDTSIALVFLIIRFVLRDNKRD